jgi:hypothetical protein
MTRIGRNDSCPCGSGKKYKNCCSTREKLLFPKKTAIGVGLSILFVIAMIWLLAPSKSAPTGSVSTGEEPRTTPDTASRTGIRGVDLSRLTEEQKVQVMRQANQRTCTCEDCDLTIVVCRESMNCSTSLSIAQAMVNELENANLPEMPIFSGKDTPIDSIPPKAPFSPTSDTASGAGIPGADLSGLTDEQKAEVIRQAKQQNCTCGNCSKTIVACRNSMSCPTSLLIAQMMIRDATSGSL